MKADGRMGLVKASLLDRLLDDRPEENVEASPEAWMDLARIKLALARDLEALLNTRCSYTHAEALEPYPRVRDSLLLFGIVDLSSLSLLNPEHRRGLQEGLRCTIERFEPRLGDIRVNLEVQRDLIQVLRFRVDALLRIHPNRPPVRFDALLQLSSGRYVVRE